MDSASRQQLQMVWPELPLAAPPQPVLPREYRLRAFQPEDDADYLTLMAQAGFDTFDRNVLKQWLGRVIPGAFVVVVHRPFDRIVATAMGSHNPNRLHPRGSELGWVAASPAHTGKGLGKVVSAAATARLLGAGYRRIYLRTDDWRLPAIKVYLWLGYIPFLFAADMETRWEAVCENLNWSFTPDIWPKKGARR